MGEFWRTSCTWKPRAQLDGLHIQGHCMGASTMRIAAQVKHHVVPACTMAARQRTLAALEHLKLALLHHVELARAQAGVALFNQDLARLRGTSMAPALSCSLVLGRRHESAISDPRENM